MKSHYPIKNHIILLLTIICTLSPTTSCDKAPSIHNSFANSVKSGITTATSKISSHSESSTEIPQRRNKSTTTAEQYLSRNMPLSYSYVYIDYEETEYDNEVGTRLVFLTPKKTLLHVWSSDFAMFKCNYTISGNNITIHYNGFDGTETIKGTFSKDLKKLTVDNIDGKRMTLKRDNINSYNNYFQDYNSTAM